MHLTALFSLIKFSPCAGVCVWFTSRHSISHEHRAGLQQGPWRKRSVLQLWSWLQCKTEGFCGTLETFLLLQFPLRSSVRALDGRKCVGGQVHWTIDLHQRELVFGGEKRARGCAAQRRARGGPARAPSPWKPPATFLSPLWHHTSSSLPAPPCRKRWAGESVGSKEPCDSGWRCCKCSSTGRGLSFVNHMSKGWGWGGVCMCPRVCAAGFIHVVENPL